MDIKVFLDYIRIRSFAPILVLVFTGAFVGGGMASFSYPVFLALISIGFACAGATSLNNYYDFEIDKIAHPERPLPSGKITSKQGLSIALFCFVIALLFAAFVNLPFFSMVILGYGICVLYEKVTKDQGILGNILVALLSGITVCGGFAVNNPIPALVVSLLVFPQALGGEILRDVRDIEGDRLKRRTLPMQIGEKSALYVGCYFIGTSMIFIPVPMLLHIFTFWYLIGMGFASILMIIGIILSVKNIKNVIKTITITKAALLISVIACVFGSL
jgi:geranylgeranylglycerol-phosphate geranylgeranyltransferase